MWSKLWKTNHKPTMFLREKTEFNVNNLAFQFNMTINLSRRMLIM